MKQLEVTQLWNKTQHQLRADEFQIPLLHKYLFVSGKAITTHSAENNGKIQIHIRPFRPSS